MDIVKSYLNRKKKVIERKILETPLKCSFKVKYELINELGLILHEIDKHGL